MLPLFGLDMQFFLFYLKVWHLLFRPFLLYVSGVHRSIFIKPTRERELLVGFNEYSLDDGSRSLLVGICKYPPTHGDITVYL